MCCSSRCRCFFGWMQANRCLKHANGRIGELSFDTFSGVPICPVRPSTQIPTAMLTMVSLGFPFEGGLKKHACLWICAKLTTRVLAVSSAFQRFQLHFESKEPPLWVARMSLWEEVALIPKWETGTPVALRGVFCRSQSQAQHRLEQVMGVWEALPWIKRLKEGHRGVGCLKNPLFWIVWKLWNQHTHRGGCQKYDRFSHPRC